MRAALPAAGGGAAAWRGAQRRRMRVTRSAAAAASAPNGDDTWRANLLTTDADVRALVLSARRVAVLGIKTEAKAEQPAYHVPEYLQEQGVRIVPVPVYFPEATTILNEPVFRTLAAVPPPQLDVVCVFRRPQDVAAHVEDLLAARPRAVWLQSGIRNDASAEVLTKAGIRVVQDRCMLVEHAAAMRSRI